MEIDTEIIVKFTQDNKEALAKIDNELVAMENGKKDQEVIHYIMRLAHNLKGTCGFFALNKLGDLAHHFEILLEKALTYNKKLPPAFINLVFQFIDAIKEINDYVSEHYKEPKKDFSNLLKEAQKIEQTFTKKAVKKQSTTVVKQSKNNDHLVSSTLIDDMTIYLQELVITKNRLVRILSNDSVASPYTAAIRKFDRTINSLKTLFFRTRVSDISNVWQSYPRFIRDTAKQLGKKVKFECKGGEVQLDHFILDKIAKPLKHILTNCLDHGVDTPAERKKNKKNSVATITISAKYNNNNVQVSISDDGRGIDLDKIKEKIIKTKIVKKSDAEKLSEYDLMQYIFHTGISTKKQATKLSGRGIGMDIAAKTIHNLHGSIETISHKNEGTTFNINLPMTLAMTSAVILDVDGQNLALQKNTVVEIIKVNNNSNCHIEYYNDVPTLMLNNQLIPLIHLCKFLGLSSKKKILQSSSIVICKILSNVFGIVVDHANSIEETVTKPLPAIFSNLNIYSNIATSMNDNLILMLNSNKLLEYAKAMCMMIDKLSLDIDYKSSSITHDNSLLPNKYINIAFLESSDFFKKLIPPLLEKSGYKVIDIDTGEDLLSHLDTIEAIVIDINLLTEIKDELSKDFKKIENLPMIVTYSHDHTFNFEHSTKKTNTTELIKLLSEVMQ